MEAVRDDHDRFRNVLAADPPARERPVRAFELARSSSGTRAGPWQIVSRPGITVYGDTMENYEFLDTGGRRALLVTSNQLDRPELFLLTGAPNDPTDDLRRSGPARRGIARRTDLVHWSVPPR